MYHKLVVYSKTLLDKFILDYIQCIFWKNTFTAVAVTFSLYTDCNKRRPSAGY